jgi:hypothetical protein
MNIYLLIIMPDVPFAHETHIRNAFLEELASYRPNEKVIGRELTYEQPGARVDLRTVDSHQTIREWEFKIKADYSALGQILVYVALARAEYSNQRIIRGVLAAFAFPERIRYTVEALNLGIELYVIPPALRSAGNIPINLAPDSIGNDFPFLFGLPTLINS